MRACHFTILVFMKLHMLDRWKLRIEDSFDFEPLDTTILSFLKSKHIHYKPYFFELYAFIINFFSCTMYPFIMLTSTLVPGINCYVIITHPFHQLQVRKRSSSICYMNETYTFESISPYNLA